MASNCRKQTPKSLYLGLTVRHLTGSSQLLTMLSRLGHCHSVTSVIGYETSFAELQLQTESEIPPGFSKCKPTVLVWDNIDFGEETLSGHGTTHHTNGIMLQSKPLESPAVTREMSLSKGVRFIVPQCRVIEPYFQQKRHGPKKLGVNSDIDSTYTCHIVGCHKKTLVMWQ